jgi:hypothetical protein
VVVSTVPAPFDTITDLHQAIRFEFDERISEQVGGGSLRDAVTISPRVGLVDVSHGRRGLTVRVPGGLRPGLVYRVTLEPVVSDMFGNQLGDAFELVFSTGGDPTPTTLAGQVWDRITGRGVGDVTVHAIGPDSLVHVSATNRDGIYAFRYLPAGDFGVAAFEDRNRNDTIDASEVRGLVPANVAAGDTLLVDIPMLAPDTLPAVLRSVEALDSVTVVVGFDDFLDPDRPAGDVAVGIELEGGTAPAVASVLHEAEYAEYVDAVADSFARLDSLDRAAEVARAAVVADTLAPADSLRPTPPAIAQPDTAPPIALRPVVVPPVVGDPAPDTTVADPSAADSTVADTVPEPPPGRRPPVPLTPVSGSNPGLMEGTGRMLPSSRLVLLLVTPLEQDVEYGVRVSSVVNINGLEGGGGEATFVLEAPVPDTTAVDTMAVPRVDTTAVPRVDTMATPPVDTIAVPPVDTVGAASSESPTRAPREAPLGWRFPSDLVPAYAPEPAFRPARGRHR